MGMSSSSSDDLNSDINVTPFVDVMLVLLVIFMVTAPLLNTGVNIDLPQSQNVVENDPEGKLTLSIDMKPCPQPKPGCFVAPIFLGKLPIRWTELGEKLLLNPRVQNEKELFIEADKDLPYSVVVKAMAVAQANGVAKLQMRTDMSPTIDLSEMDKPLGTEGDSR